VENDLPKSIIDHVYFIPMKFLASIFITALLAFAAGLFLPWWSIAIAAAIVAVVVKQSSAKSALAGLLGGFLCWGGLAAYISLTNEHVLATRVALLILKVNNPWLLVLATGLIGALVAGLAALAGSFLVAGRSSKPNEQPANDALTEETTERLPSETEQPA